MGLTTLFVAPERQNELTRRIQQKLAGAEKKKKDEKTTEGLPPAPSAPEAPASLADTEPVTAVVR